MKRLIAITGLCFGLLSVPPSFAAMGTFGGLEMLHKLFIINKVLVSELDSAAEVETSTGSTPNQGVKDSENWENWDSTSKGMAHFSTLLLLEDAQDAKLTTEIVFGEFIIEPVGGDTLLFVKVEYDPKKFPPPVMDYRRRNGHVTISLESADIIDDDFDEQRKSLHNTWHIYLGRDVTWQLKLDLAACDTRMELGGLKVENLTVESGLSDTKLSFSEPNRIVLEKCQIETGVGSFEAFQLGNAVIRRLSLENGLGSSVLDFSGKHPFEALKARIESGLGSVEMQLPDGLPVLMQVETFLGNSDLPGFDRLNGGNYRSISYQEGVPGLDADVSVGMGTVNVIWLPVLPLAPEAPILLEEELQLQQEELLQQQEEIELQIEQLPSPPKPPKKAKVAD